MTVKRITATLNAPSVAALETFYQQVFGLKTQMDFGWFATLGSGKPAPVQLNLASSGGDGKPVPELSIEVDNLDEVHALALKHGHDILYGPAEEDYGVRRFMLLDPADNLINVMQHL
ncbi:glyoxalase [Lentibacter algarum]|uniref:VOC family protein n=1 Tax=Lentibacter algarum TaxID=576131 RepID=UPI001C06B328|nr:VOC family protein [Lentibacter algarum]MBU2981805.1 glyoxalase [Lentibacter algarum]